MRPRPPVTSGWRGRSRRSSRRGRAHGRRSGITEGRIRRCGSVHRPRAGRTREFGDPQYPQCPRCASFARRTGPEAPPAVGAGVVRLIRGDRSWIGEESERAAIAVRAAARQGRFWPFHDALVGASVPGERRSPRRRPLRGIVRRWGLDLISVRRRPARPGDLGPGRRRDGVRRGGRGAERPDVPGQRRAPLRGVSRWRPSWPPSGTARAVRWRAARRPGPRPAPAELSRSDQDRRVRPGRGRASPAPPRSWARRHRHCRRLCTGACRRPRS